MVKINDVNNINNANMTQEASALNEADIIYNKPVHKLDADQFIAQDIDAGTETLSGSGNLNYALLQQSQKNLSFLDGFQDIAVSENSFLTPSQNISHDAGLSGMETSVLKGDGSSVLNASDIAQGGGGSALSAQEGANLATTVFSEAFIDSSVAPDVGLSGIRFPNAGSGFGNNTLNGSAGQAGMDGQDGSDGASGSGGDKIINIINNEGPIINIDIEQNFENIINVENILGDTYEFLTVTITEIFEFLGDTQIIDLINPIKIIKVTGDIVLEVLNEITDVLHKVLDLDLNDLLSIDLQLVLDEITSLDLALDTINDLGLNIQEYVDLSPVTGLLDNVIDVGQLLPANVNVGFDLFNPQDSQTDEMDLSLNLGLEGALGLDIPDIVLDVPLDPIEGLIGDIDLGIDIPLDVLQGVDLGDALSGISDGVLGKNGAEDTDVDVGIDLGILGHDIPEINLNPTIDLVEDIIGDLDLGVNLGLDLLGGSENTNNADGDQDIVVQTDIEIVDNLLNNTNIDIVLDPLESIVGDVDLEINLGLDILGDAANNLIDSASGGNADGILSDIGDTFHGIADKIIPDKLIESLSHEIDVEISIITDILDHSGNAELTDALNGITDWTESGLSSLDELFGNKDGTDALSNVVGDTIGSVVEGIGALDIDILGGGFGGGIFG